jgi:Holliday junction resolvase-like predicted endonuclease
VVEQQPAPLTANPAIKIGKRRDHSLVARLGEQTASEWLIARGYRIIDRNWHGGRHSEIDIVAIDADDLLTFVEVKTRRLDPQAYAHLRRKLSPEGIPDDLEARTQAFETLNWKKRRKVIKAALSYIARNKIADPSCQLDAIVITFRNVSHNGQCSRLEDVSVFHIPRAFSDL